MYRTLSSSAQLEARVLLETASEWAALHPDNPTTPEVAAFLRRKAFDATVKAAKFQPDEIERAALYKDAIELGKDIGAIDEAFKLAQHVVWDDRCGTPALVQEITEIFFELQRGLLGSESNK